MGQVLLHHDAVIAAMISPSTACKDAHYFPQLPAHASQPQCWTRRSPAREVFRVLCDGGTWSPRKLASASKVHGVPPKKGHVTSETFVGKLPPTSVPQLITGLLLAT